MDEATSTLDDQTEKMLQKILDTRLQQSTVISITHKLINVVNYDKVMVMKNGSIIEFDDPQRLLSDDSSYFY